MFIICFGDIDAMTKRIANGQFVGQCANGFHSEVPGDVDPHIEHFDGVSINSIERRVVWKEWAKGKIVA